MRRKYVPTREIASPHLAFPAVVVAALVLSSRMHKPHGPLHRQPICSRRSTDGALPFQTLIQPHCRGWQKVSHASVAMIVELVAGPQVTTIALPRPAIAAPVVLPLAASRCFIDNNCPQNAERDSGRDSAAALSASPPPAMMSQLDRLLRDWLTCQLTGNCGHRPRFCRRNGQLGRWHLCRFSRIRAQCHYYADRRRCAQSSFHHSAPCVWALPTQHTDSHIVLET